MSEQGLPAPGSGGPYEGGMESVDAMNIRWRWRELWNDNYVAAYAPWIPEEAGVDVLVILEGLNNRIAALEAP